MNTTFNTADVSNHPEAVIHMETTVHSQAVRHVPEEITRLMRRAMASPDDFVIEMQYADSKGNLTHRTVSPIRFVGSDRVLALCLCREEPRQFYLSRCTAVRLKRAEDVLMPIAMA